MPYNAFETISCIALPTYGYITAVYIPVMSNFHFEKGFIIKPVEYGRKLYKLFRTVIFASFRLKMNHFVLLGKGRERARELRITTIRL